MIVLDTNVVSELMRPSGSDTLLTWFRHQRHADLRTSSITVAEIQYGVARLPESRRQRQMAEDAAKVWTLFPDAVLPFDETAANEYARVRVRRERAGRPIHRFDAQIAAICLVHRATLATRNVKDFEGTGVEVVDPWSA